MLLYLLIGLIILLFVFRETNTQFRLITRNKDGIDYVSLIDSNEEVVWETPGSQWSIENGELVFRDKEGRITLASNTSGGSSIRLQKGGEFHGLNLIDKRGNILWNPSHYTKFIDATQSFKNGVIVYRNPITQKLFT